jgi:hypothetical protein
LVVVLEGGFGIGLEKHFVYQAFADNGQCLVQNEVVASVCFLHET